MPRCFVHGTIFLLGLCSTETFGSLVISVTDYFCPWIFWSLDIKFPGYLDPISFKPGTFLSPNFLATEYFVPGTFYSQCIGKNVIFCCCLETKNVQSIG